MGKKYENEFKLMLVELLSSGRSSKELSEEYGIDRGIINRWKREYKSKSGDFSKKREVSSQELELKELKRELRDVRLERDILKKAVSIFSRSDK